MTAGFGEVGKMGGGGGQGKRKKERRKADRRQERGEGVYCLHTAEWGAGVISGTEKKKKSRTRTNSPGFV